VLSLNEVWFLLIAVLFVGFFFLEGFDFGVGMSVKLLARKEVERRVLINTIGPFWDANEVWLITAAGAMFAAFPHWYSTMFSGYYIPLALVLLALIGRGVAFEFRSKLERAAWKKAWDWAIFIGSVMPPLMFGMMLAASVKGVPVGGDMEMDAGFTDVVNGYTVWAGVTVTALCWWHGLTFVGLRTEGDLRERAHRMAWRLLPVLAVLLAGHLAWTVAATDLFARRGVLMTAMTVAGAGALAAAGWFVRRGRDGWAFSLSGALVIVTVAALFAGLFPRVMVSSIDRAYDLTLHNAAASPTTLKAMTMVTAALLPFVLGYMIWSYIVFRKRVSEKEHLEY